VFYAREPYTNKGAVHVTRFIGLGTVGNKEKQVIILVPLLFITLVTILLNLLYSCQFWPLLFHFSFALVFLVSFVRSSY
jgi:hypothetical protein